MTSGDPLDASRLGAQPARDWSAWRQSAPYSVGIEEEVMLVDPAGWGLAQRVEDVLGGLPPELTTYFGAETHQAAVELSTEPALTIAAVAGRLAALRASLAHVLGRLNLVAAAAGLHPTTVWTETQVSPRSRYQLIHSTMRVLAQREPTFALHVHIGVSEPDAAIDLMNRMRAHLPVLLALSANSPYWQGRDTGFASARTLVFQTFPRTGLPRRFESYADWRAVVDSLLRAGAIPEPTFLWWDIRPQPRFGTVEVRIMDSQCTLDRVAALAALVQSLARLELEERYASPALVRAHEVLCENRFLAARDGMDAKLIEPQRGRLRPVREQLAELLEAARPHARRLDCLSELDAVEQLAEPSAADLQRRRGAQDGLAGVVARQSEEFEATEVR